ncbi:hypothetical protein CLV63_101508 [Murinocardiopsis flavida]|uniref:Uncharacterized protein n=2 Tax=Murinocardiopsis flavida TaxID=645275 RepID=A0A2P8DUX4_9ACTN|nr:hypothetical protein CLV63_101508 [Murinocardiopsis flavida]
MADAGPIGLMRQDLRRQTALTREAVERADAADTPIGELRQQVAELARHADRIDAQLGSIDRLGALHEPEALASLRTRVDTLSATFIGVRAHLAQEEATRSDAELAETVERVRIETEALKSIRGADPLPDTDPRHGGAGEQNTGEPPRGPKGTG